jgi:hypothetical protein
MASTGISGNVKLCFGEKQTTLEIPLSGFALKKVCFASSLSLGSFLFYSKEISSCFKEAK